jgi:hypothetical protein
MGAEGSMLLWKEMIYTLISIILELLFTLMNGKLIQNHDGSVISFYEVHFLFSLWNFVLYQNKFSLDFFVLSFSS